MNKKLVLGLVILLSLFSIFSVDFDNITYTNEEFLGVKILKTQTIELSNSKLLVTYVKNGDDVPYSKICDLNGTNCGTETGWGTFGENSFNVFEDTTNNKIVIVAATISGTDRLWFKSANLDMSSISARTDIQVAGANYVDSVQTNSTHFAVVFQDTADSSRGKLVLCTLDGSSCSSEITITSSSNTWLKIIKTTTDELTILFQFTTAGLYTRQYDLEGNLLVGSTLLDSGSHSYTDMIEGTDNKIKVVYRDVGGSNFGTFITCDLDGTNCGSEIVFNSDTTSFNNIVEFDSKLFTSSQRGTVTKFLTSYNFNLTGGDISSPSFFSTVEVGDNSLILTSLNQLVISFDDRTNSKGLFAITEVLGTGSSDITFNNPTQDEIINDTAFLLNVSFTLTTNSTYILNGGSETTLGTNENESTANLVGVEGLNNITVFTNTSGALANSSLNFTIDTTNPIINNTLPTEINNYFLNISEFVSCSDDNIFICNITFTPDEQTYLVNQTSLVNFTYNGNQTYLIELEDLAGNKVTDNGTILINPVTNITFFDSNGTQITDYTLGGLSFTDTANISFYNSILEVGTNNTLLFEKVGFNSGNITFELLNTSRININYTIPFAQLIFFFLDVTDGSLIDDQNITLEIIGTTFSQQYEVNETSNFSIVEPLITAGAYTVSVISQDYSVVFRNFVYDNQENLTLAIYMTPKVVVDETITDLIVQVQDTYKSVQPSIPVIQYIWQSDVGQYVVVNEKVTNGFGQTTFSVFLDTKLYQFCAEFNNELFCESGVTVDAATIILPITIDLLEDIVVNNSEIYFKNFTHSLFNTTTNTTIDVGFTWNNQRQDVNEYCLSIQERVFSTQTYIYNNCSTSHSSGLTYLITISENSTYIATSYIKVGQDERILDQLFLNVFHPLQQELIANGLHIIGALLLLFGAIGIGYNKKIHNVSVTHILLPIVSIAIFAAFPIIHNIETVLMVALVNIFAFTMITKTFEQNKVTNMRKMIFIILIYFIFIGSLIVFLQEMDSKNILDERGEQVLDYLTPLNIELQEFFINTNSNLETQQVNAKEGDFDIFNIVFTKSLGFLDTFFQVLGNIFIIPVTLLFLLNIESAILTLFAQALSFIFTMIVVQIFFSRFK